MIANSCEWIKSEWLMDAKRLIHWTINQDSKDLLMLVIRHSHREDSSDVQELLKKRLTELGQRMAFQFGQELTTSRNVKIFFSSHPRCFETAQEIAEGYISVGGQAVLVSDIRVLLGPKGSGDRIGHEMLSLGGPEFVKRWIHGKLSTDTMEPIENFGTVFIKETLGRLQNASENTLHIHVTHDLVLMGARNVLLGTIPTIENWTPYLGGFGIMMRDGLFHAYEGGKELSLDTKTILGVSTFTKESP